MKFIIENEGLLGLFKGIAPQITKGLLVQGLLMMTKERLARPSTVRDCTLIDNRMELMFVILFRYLRKLRSDQLQKAANIAVAATSKALPIVTK
jgi:hypothetical protein